MKRLLYIAFIINPLIGFTQEKKGICSSAIHLFHDSGNDSISDDHFKVDGFFLNNPLYYGSFKPDSTHLDSTIYEITLPFGSSMQYSAYWRADGMCYPLSGPEVLDSIITILEGVSFQIIHEGSFDGPNTYSLSQEGFIQGPCFFKIHRDYTYFIRVKFQDPPEPETPLDLPKVTNDISMWLSNENTLTAKVDEDVVWELNLYSLSGQMIQKYQLKGSQDLEISKLPQGCYVAHISSKNDLKKQVKFIK